MAVETGFLGSLRSDTAHAKGWTLPSTVSSISVRAKLPSWAVPAYWALNEESGSSRSRNADAMA